MRKKKVTAKSGMTICAGGFDGNTTRDRVGKKHESRTTALKNSCEKLLVPLKALFFRLNRYAINGIIS